MKDFADPWRTAYLAMAKKMDIFQKINFAYEQFLTMTGMNPVSIYLGREEMAELLRMAEENGYIASAKDCDKEGSSRPEVMGMKAFEVNADSHLSFGVIP